MNDFAPLVARLERSASTAPDRDAIVQGPRRVTYAELWAQVRAVAGSLRQRGMAAGDRVAILSENSPEYVAAYYAALAAGGVAVGLNVAARARELSAWLDHSQARWLFADVRHPDFAQLVSEHRSRVQIVGIGGTTSADEFAWSDAVNAAPIAPVPVEPNAGAAIIYTSGTTGRPKGVTLTHGNLSANTSSIIEYLGLTSEDRVLNSLPFFYSYGASVLHTHVASAATLVLENRLVYAQQVLTRMAEERVTGFPGVPSTFALLLQCSDLTKFDLPALRYLTQAGGAMPTANVSKIRALLPHAQLFVMYGQTEATARLTYVPPARLEEKLGSAGIPIPGVELRIEGETGEVLPAGEIGEVCVRGANVMLGYFRDADATAAVLRNGWLHTGDVGSLDRDGFLFLQGRRSDIIKSGAHRISPMDIEEVIAALPQVAEVAVVGIPDPVLGEVIKAVVALRPGAALDAMTVQQYCIQHLPRYKVPKRVEFAGKLPRTSSGKIMRYQLTGTV